ncbi:uncharacterized protein B0H64DRAFT_142412 [Chaetomium fimeti]|uniref:RING-type E3 ubiquitin transferase n=1 Tax=Chaetomium fimeti TaxID=1854472 RepID=A0AAE0HGI1_9PEZI|nr:hypothetical protein B0H64DRAFT_142412 [Chaetomium fimeti]
MNFNGVPIHQPPDSTLDAVMGGLPSDHFAKLDPDTCRICRGEGSADEPLFFPCKCSGSIKYVHQDCLMEWLSHSQKKHCELCKTSFRFTKLYDPNMPTGLPAHVFISHTTKYVLRKLLVWMRAALVANVWLCWLPYIMRTVWAFLFWISDEGLGGRPAFMGPAGDVFDLAGTVYGTDVCPSSPLFAATTTVATIGGVIDNLPPASAKLVKGLYGINLTSSDPVYSTILRLLFGGVGLADKSAAITAAADATASARLRDSAPQSLLGGVTFLRNLTRHPSINRFVIDVLEGQIITILVIVCFILIILVRDYVVQQQPEINMRAAFAAAENPPQPGPAEPGRPHLQPHVQPHVQLQDIPDRAGDASDDSASETADEFETRPQREVPQGFDRATVHEYLNVYREAGGDPDHMMRIARERGLEDRLDYWLQLIARQQENRGLDENQAGPSNRPAANRPLANGRQRRASADGAGPARPIGVNPMRSDPWTYEGNFPPLPTQQGLPTPPTERPPAWPALESPTEAARPPSPTASAGDHPAPLEVETDTGDRDRAPLEVEIELGRVLPPPPPPARRAPAGVAGRIADFMWRRVDAIDEADLAPVNFRGDFAEDDPEEDGHGNPPPNPAGQNAAAADPAVAAALDAEALEDAEDLEGILELVGMRGPVVGLFQNAIFCAFLVSITIFLGVFIPYNTGRVTIWALANPMRIARIFFSLSKFVQDCALLALGLASSILSDFVHLVSRALMLPSVAEHSMGVANTSWTTAVGAAKRIGGSFVTELPFVSASEVRNFSAISHAALFTLKGYVAAAFSGIWRLLDFVLGGDYTAKGAAASAVAVKVLPAVWQSLAAFPATVVDPNSWVLNLNLPAATVAIDTELAYWGGTDRFWAILAGYVATSMMAALYLRRGTPFSTNQAAQQWETVLMDVLNQASGVMKVLLIISIEMLVFPLYCGMLLDVALLPLFEHTTFKSRLMFTINYPVTSIFVHWFIGTGYMFHFALFVSMCRKIMRKGVLYFIRDPDDPDFHPIRDVLERSVTTQLRKILFSAFVYGALVIVCLGGVVWGLSLSLPVLPIHNSSNEPVLEFPIDLLFYNFLMPFAISFFKPSHWLHAMYRWWFRRCARALRITWFLFGERRLDEEGWLALAPNSPDRKLPAWRQWFLEVDAGGRVVARSWRGILEGGATKRPAIRTEHMTSYNTKKEALVFTGQLIPDGRFVRTPASDQVKIPKGTGVFIDVNEDNTRRDKLADQPETDIYSTEQYQFVYLPPDFGLRIFLFILFIWIFAAATGVSITILPLVFGRWMFSQLIPAHVRANDIYAFSIGIHVLGSAVYALLRAPAAYQAARAYVEAAVAADGAHGMFRRMRGIVARAARVLYAYFFVLVVAPLLVASLMELYALVPLNELMYGTVLKPDFAKALAAGTAKPAAPVHTVPVVQTWTIGLLYLKLSMRITNTWFRGSRVSNAARAVLRRGWLDPDAAILTRAFVVPSLSIWLAAVVTPLLVARFAVADGFADAVMREHGMVPAHGPPDRALYEACVVLIYRMSFPMVALAILSGFALWSTVGVCRRWQVRIRDEAYLIGERLHNFGATNAPRPRGAWRATGVRA